MEFWTERTEQAVSELKSLDDEELHIELSVRIAAAVQSKETTARPISGSASSAARTAAAEACADALVESIGKNEFLCLPHKEVHKYMKRKADDTGRWIKGMQRLQARYDQVMKSAIWGENSKL